MKIEQEQEDSFEVQMGPLIDCVFLLLIFFLVVAVTKKTLRDLDLVLPDVQHVTEAKPRDENLVIRVTQAGGLYVGSDEVTRQTLKAAIRDRAERNREAKVLIEADTRVPMTVVAPILDELQFSGLRNVAFRAAVYAGSTGES